VYWVKQQESGEQPEIRSKAGREAEQPKVSLDPNRQPDQSMFGA